MQALVNNRDFSALNKFSWYADNCRGLFYARRAITLPNGKQKKISMHRVILGNPEFLVDHKNGNTLDNRRKNLRRATSAQQKQNSGLSGERRYKGVYFQTQRAGGLTYSYIRSQIRAEGRIHFLGSFPTEQKAAEAYDRAAKKFFGRFARVNFPQTKRKYAGAHN